MFRRKRWARLFHPHAPDRGWKKKPYAQTLIELCSAHLCEPEEARRRVVAGAQEGLLREWHTVEAKTPGGIAAFLGDGLLTKGMVVWWNDGTFDIMSSEGWITLEAA